METKRFFIGLSFVCTDSIKCVHAYLSEHLVPLLAPYNATLKIEEKVHMTLLFIGEVSGNRVEEIAQLFSKTAQQFFTKGHAQNNFSLFLKPHISLFGKHKEVVVLECDAPKIVYDFVQQMGVVFDAHGISYANDRSFVPHITLARIRAQRRDDFVYTSIVNDTTITDVLHKTAQISAGQRLNIRACILFESCNGKHKPIASIVI